MRLLVAVIWIACLSAGAEYFLPWWSLAVAAFLVALVMRLGSGRSFLAGFTGVGLCWLIVALTHDIANDHILSTRMAALLPLPNYALFTTVTVFIGALVGGLAAWAGGLMRSRA